MVLESWGGKSMWIGSRRSMWSVRKVVVVPKRVKSGSHIWGGSSWAGGINSGMSPRFGPGFIAIKRRNYTNWFIIIS